MDNNSILDPRGPEGDRRALAPGGNGKAEWIRWAVSLLLAALVAYGTVAARISAVEATAEARHDELKRFMERVDRYIQSEKLR